MRTTAPVEQGTHRARCAGLAELFFSDEVDDIERAKEVCATCGLRRQCLLGALHRRESCGVWGGQLLRDGVVLARAPRRGRPRSVA